MKILKVLLPAFIIATIIGCSTTITPRTAENYKPTYKQGEKPQYIISVFQEGESLGDIQIELFPDVAPKHCRNFDSLVYIGFYDSTAFHRVIPGFMIQGGDPNTKSKSERYWGSGDPSQRKIPAEFNDIPHDRGILSAARTNDPNSATSQFFICVAAAHYLNNKYTVYGKVLKGMEVADKVVNSPRDGRDRPNKKIIMKIKRLAEEKK